MRSITLTRSNGESFKINLPTELSEITPEEYLDFAKNIEVGSNYVLVACVLCAKLSEIMAYFNSKKPTNNTSVGLIPIYIKEGANSSDNGLNCKTGDRLVITGTDLGRGIHIALKNSYNPRHIVNMIAKDPIASRGIFTGACYDNSDVYKERSPRHYFLTFKLVPKCDIHGIIHEESDDAED